MQCVRGPLVVSVGAHGPLERRCDGGAHRAVSPAAVVVAAAASLVLCSSSALAADLADFQSASSYYQPQHPVVRQRQPPQSSSIAEATARLTAAREAEDAGEYSRALQLYTEVCDKHRDLALVHRARLARALLLFQVGEREESLLALEDEVVDVGFGNADVRAALAVALHATRPAQVGRAEEEWDTATRYAPKFADEQWVRKTKRWPPKLMTCLHQWLTLD